MHISSVGAASKGVTVEFPKRSKTGAGRTTSKVSHLSPHAKTGAGHWFEEGIAKSKTISASDLKINLETLNE